MAKFGFIIAYLASILYCAIASNESNQTTKPNIVFVFVDHWGYADVGFHNPAVKTPNFDMLARTGLILDRHYIFKLCSPSRAYLLIGRWPHHVHQFNIICPHVACDHLEHILFYFVQFSFTQYWLLSQH